MAKERSLQEFKRIYNYAEIDDDTFLKFYQTAKKTDNINESFHKMVINYLKSNADINIIKKIFKSC